MNCLLQNTSQSRCLISHCARDYSTLRGSKIIPGLWYKIIRERCKCSISIKAMFLFCSMRLIDNAYPESNWQGFHCLVYYTINTLGKGLAKLELREPAPGLRKKREVFVFSKQRVCWRPCSPGLVHMITQGSHCAIRRDWYK